MGFDVLVFFSAGHFKFLEIRVAIEEFLVTGDTVVFDPYVRADEPVRQPPDTRLPVADEKIEIVGAVVRWSRRRRLRICRCAQDDEC